MTFAFQRNIGHRQIFVQQRIHHRFGLIRRHHFVVKTLKEDYRTGKTISVMNG